MIRRPPESTRTYTLFPYTTLFRSVVVDRDLRQQADLHRAGEAAQIEVEPRAVGRGAADLVELDRQDLHRTVEFGPVLGQVAGEPAELLDVLDQWRANALRSEGHTSELQTLMRSSYDVLCLKKKTKRETYAKIGKEH